MSSRTTIQIAMKADLVRSDLREGLVWFVNYVALDPTAVKSSDLDLHGAGMLPQDVEKFAHRWLAHSRSIDIEHDGIGRPINVIESFFNSSDVSAMAWPLNTHAVRFDISQSDEAMKGMKEGSLNSVSLDAYTFNKVVRLPAAQAKSMGVIDEPFVPPTTVLKWAEELARDGYEGITGVHSVGPDMYIAQRENGLPVAITVKNGCLEASTAAGPWGHIGLALVQSPTLTSKALGIEGNDVQAPRGAQGEMTTGWSPDVVSQLLAEYGVMSPDAQASAIDTLTARLRHMAPPTQDSSGDPTPEDLDPMQGLPADMPISTPVSPRSPLA